MATILDNRSQYGSMGYESMGFTNPWGERVHAAQSQLYQMPPPPSTTMQQVQQPASRTSSLSMPYANTVSRNPSVSLPYANAAATSSMSADLMPPPRSYPADFSNTAPTQQTYAPTVATRYSPEYAQSVASSYGYDDGSRRASYQFNAPPSGRNSFSDQLDASRGMIAMSQDITPRNVYGFSTARQSSQDGYGFPISAQSQHSSISSASTYPSYYAGSYSGSIDGSVTDYNSSAEEVLGARTLPVPSQLIGGFPPEPSSMMGQFSSKTSPAATKKHACTYCDKRFTRPSSLQTHIYSHTGEKPFGCEHDGCGRHFSVVSNLRRHRKVHQEDKESDERSDN